MKKLTAILLAGMLTASLAACGTPAETAPAETTPTETTGDEGSTEEASGDDSGRKLASDYAAELSYVSWNSAQEEQNQATVDAFKEMYPNININISYSPWNEYWNKLEASATGGNMGQMITQHTNNIELYVNNGFVEDLTNLSEYDPEFSYDPHPEDVKKLYRFDDKMWGVPKDFDCIVLVYNTEMFDAAGLEYPNNDWTWTDLEDAAKVLTDKDNNVYGFSAGNYQQDGYASFMYQNGGGLLSEDGKTSIVDTPESIEAIEWWYHMYTNYGPSQAMIAETTKGVLFASGIVAMQTVGNWELIEYYDNEEVAGKFDIAALPIPEGGVEATVMNGLALTVTTEAGGSTPEQIEAAKQFAAYFGTYQGQLDAAMGPSIPCYEGVSDTWAELNTERFDTSAVLDQMDAGVQWIGTELKTQWNQALETRMANIYDGADIKTELEAAAAEMNEILAKE